MVSLIEKVYCCYCWWFVARQGHYLDDVSAMFRVEVWGMVEHHLLRFVHCLDRHPSWVDYRNTEVVIEKRLRVVLRPGPFGPKLTI